MLNLKRIDLNRKSKLIEEGETEEPLLVTPTRTDMKNIASIISDNRSTSAFSTTSTKIAWSDAGYVPKEGQDEGVKFLGIYGKPGISF